MPPRASAEISTVTALMHDSSHLRGRRPVPLRSVERLLAALAPLDGQLVETRSGGLDIWNDGDTSKVATDRTAGGAVAAALEGVVNGNVIVDFGAAAAGLCLDSTSLILGEAANTDGSECCACYYPKVGHEVDAHAGIRPWKVWATPLRPCSPSPRGTATSPHATQRRGPGVWNKTWEFLPSHRRSHLPHTDAGAPSDRRPHRALLSKDLMRPYVQGLTIWPTTLICCSPPATAQGGIPTPRRPPALPRTARG